MQDINNQEELINSAHKNWLEHPMTKAVLEKIKAHREKFILSLSANALNFSGPNGDGVCSEKYRTIGAGLKTCDAILVLIKEPTNLVLTNKQQAELL